MCLVTACVPISAAWPVPKNNSSLHKVRALYDTPYNINCSHKSRVTTMSCSLIAQPQKCGNPTHDHKQQLTLSCIKVRDYSNQLYVDFNAISYLKKTLLSNWLQAFVISKSVNWIINFSAYICQQFSYWHIQYFDFFCHVVVFLL